MLSPWILARLPLGPAADRSPRMFPRGPFVQRYMAAFAVWNLAVGAFNPFFSAYFSRELHMTVKQIGIVFSISQAVQLAALLLAPAILRRLGMVTGIASMQVGVGASLALLAAGPTATLAAAAYSAFMSFQFMCEPGTFTLLMNRVAESERAGVSALNFFVMSASQAASAGVAGFAVTRYGYAPVLTTAAAIAIVAALLFRLLLADAAEAPPERSPSLAEESQTNRAAHTRFQPLPPELAHHAETGEAASDQGKSCDQ